MYPNTSQTGQLPAAGFIRLAQLIPAIVPWSAATHWRKVKSGHFPAPVKLSDRVTAWRIEDVRAWMNSRTGAACDQGVVLSEKLA